VGCDEELGDGDRFFEVIEGSNIKTFVIFIAARSRSTIFIIAQHHLIRLLIQQAADVVSMDGSDVSIKTALKNYRKKRERFFLIYIPFKNVCK
jgi:hypothetical protein